MWRGAIPVLALLVLSAVGGWLGAAEPLLKQGDYLAITGDSITEQQLYSLYIEEYLLMCKPTANLSATQFGWGGETAPGFALRMANDMLRFGANAATTCFGMNDGDDSPMNDRKAQRYRDGMTSIVGQLKKAGVRLIVVGSPGCVDTNTYAGGKKDRATMYNNTLAALRDIAQEVAKKEGVVFANVYDPMLETMNKANAKYGKAYHVCGSDGYHPDRNGHLVMAYAFLKALGCDGEIGTINVDLAADKAQASEGHAVLGCRQGEVEVESSRYPFCFFGDPKTTSATTGIIEFFPFNQDLNRFQLVVTGAKARQIKVTWGDASKEFTAAQLAQGVNLAAEFLDNPFCGPFRKVEEKIARQQRFEVGLVKNLLHNLPAYKAELPDESPTLERLAEKLIMKDKQARDVSAAAVMPVTHTIRIEPIGR